MDTLLTQLRGSATAILLAFALGAALALLVARLARGRRHADRLRRLSSRAAHLASGLPARALTSPDVLAGRDDLADLVRAFHAMEQRLLEDRVAREGLFVRALEELKRPLGLLATSLELALRRRAEVPELSAALRGAQQEAERIARLSGRIATLGAIARAVQRVPMDLAVVARQVYQEALPEAQQRGVKLRLEAPQALPLRGDAAALHQALAELTGNAIQASRAGGVVRLTLVREGALLRAAVHDEGPGIPRERRKQVFEPFNRGPHGWSPAGMGLAIAREVARGHGGVARAEDQEVGACLVLELPGD